MVGFTVFVSVALIILQMIFDNFQLLHFVIGISLSSLFAIATLMIIIIYAKLSTYFDTFLPVHDEKKMNISAGI